MKKNRLYILLFVFIMFFCINVGGVKAENKMCNKDVEVSKAYVCDYSGANSGILGDVSTKFSFILIQDKNNNYCSIIDNASFTYGDKIAPFGLSDDSFSAENANIRSFVLFDLNYNSILKNMKNNACPILNTRVTANFSLWGLGSYTGIKRFFVSDSHGAVCSFSSSVACINDIYGVGVRELSEEDASKRVKDALLTDDEIKEYIKKWANKTSGFDQNIEGSNSGCRTLLTPAFIEILSSSLLFISVSGVILLVVLTLFDFTKAVASNEDDALLKNFKRFKIRIIAIIILFLLPIIVNTIINYVNDYVYFDENNKIEIGNVSDCINMNN